MTPAMNGGDAVLQPAAAAARQADFGVEATRKALDHVELEGRLAVKLVQESAKRPWRPSRSPTSAAASSTARPEHQRARAIR